MDPAFGTFPVPCQLVCMCPTKLAPRRTGTRIIGATALGAKGVTRLTALSRRGVCMSDFPSAVLMTGFMETRGVSVVPVSR